MHQALRNGRARTVATATARIRCAVYCRVSSDERLGQSFNSLHAQREAAENYIHSQRAEGWVALPDDYSDGGFTGANTKRPALQRLLADVETRSVDRVIVYKLDRLTRSMRDFLNLLDFFERHSVGFVSVSQSFDTSTPIGKMTLNLLASFGEFERQVIAERTRDKIQAARRRGKWTGGMPPLGYDVAAEGGRLIVNADEAEVVRLVFELYLASPSLVCVAQELRRRALRTKAWTTRAGRDRRGRPWDKVAVRQVLTNALYVGDQVLGQERFRGEHAPILKRAVFDRVQALLAKNRSDSGASARNHHGALLRGLLRCAACERAMFHHWTRSHGRLYRYYTCQGAQKFGHAACPTKSVSATKIEEFIVAEIRRIGADPVLQDATFQQALAQVKAQRRGLKAEAKRLVRDAVTARADVERLVSAVSRTDGAAGDAIAGELGKAQERLAALEARRREVDTEHGVLAAQDIDREILDHALQAFDPIWDVLLTPERERVLRLLIDRIDYRGDLGTLTISWRLAGLGNLVDELTGGPS